MSSLTTSFEDLGEGFEPMTLGYEGHNLKDLSRGWRSNGSEGNRRAPLLWGYCGGGTAVRCWDDLQLFMAGNQRVTALSQRASWK
jgi:hypothetical protein